MREGGAKIKGGRKSADVDKEEDGGTQIGGGVDGEGERKDKIIPTLSELFWRW